MSSQIYRSAARTARALLAASRNSSVPHGRAFTVAAATLFKGETNFLSSFFGSTGSGSATRGWVSSALALPAADKALSSQCGSAVWILLGVRDSVHTSSHGVDAEVISRGDTTFLAGKALDRGRACNKSGVVNWWAKETYLAEILQVPMFTCSKTRKCMHQRWNVLL